MDWTYRTVSKSWICISIIILMSWNKQMAWAQGGRYNGNYRNNGQGQGNNKGHRGSGPGHNYQQGQTNSYEPAPNLAKQAYASSSEEDPTIKGQGPRPPTVPGQGDELPFSPNQGYTGLGAVVANEEFIPYKGPTDGDYGPSIREFSKDHTLGSFGGSFKGPGDHEGIMQKLYGHLRNKKDNSENQENENDKNNQYNKNNQRNNGQNYNQNKNYNSPGYNNQGRRNNGYGNSSPRNQQRSGYNNNGKQNPRNHQRSYIPNQGKRYNNGKQGHHRGQVQNRNGKGKQAGFNPPGYNFQQDKALKEHLKINFDDPFFKESDPYDPFGMKKGYPPDKNPSFNVPQNTNNYGNNRNNYGNSSPTKMNYPEPEKKRDNHYTNINNNHHPKDFKDVSDQYTGMNDPFDNTKDMFDFDKILSKSNTGVDDYSTNSYGSTYNNPQKQSNNYRSGGSPRGYNQGQSRGYSNNRQTGYGKSRSGYGNSQSKYGNSKSGYGNSNSKSGYGNSNGGYGNSNSGYGNSNSGYGNSNSGYGNSQSGFGNMEYGNPHPTPGYGDDYSEHERYLNGGEYSEVPKGQGYEAKYNTDKSDYYKRSSKPLSRSISRSSRRGSYKHAPPPPPRSYGGHGSLHSSIGGATLLQVTDTAVPKGGGGSSFGNMIEEDLSTPDLLQFTSGKEDHSRDRNGGGFNYHNILDTGGNSLTDLVTAVATVVGEGNMNPEVFHKLRGVGGRAQYTRRLPSVEGRANSGGITHISGDHTLISVDGQAASHLF